MNVIVVGGGKVGFYLCKTLMEHNHQPRIIEKDKKTCEYIANQLDIITVLGDGSTMDVLQTAGAEEVEAVIAVTGQDQDNMVACQIAKKIFGVRKTVARVNNPKNAEIMKKMGVDIPISSTDSIARLLEREVDTSHIKQIISLNRGEASLSEFNIPENYVLDGKRLMELSLPHESVIVSIFRDNKLIIPRGNTQILSKDKVMVIARDKAIHDLSQILRLEETVSKK